MIEQVRASVNRAIDALKSSPILLALVLLQFVVLAAVVWVSHEQSAYEHQQFELLIKIIGERHADT